MMNPERGVPRICGMGPASGGQAEYLGALGAMKNAQHYRNFLVTVGGIT
jgi:hypothetical protein